MTDDWDDTVASLPGIIDPDIPQARDAYLVVVRGNNVGTSHPVLVPAMTIGRAAGADLRINDEGVSRFHCKLTQVGDRILVEDLGSRNGTYCNGEPVSGKQRMLAEGDRLQIGTASVLRFTYVEDTNDLTPLPHKQGPVTDTLTGTHSRRYFIDRLEKDVAFAVSRKVPLALLLVHIDRYPELVIGHGQDVVDRITIGLSQQIGTLVRDKALVSRIDGGDFAVMSRSASPGDTFMLAERIRASSATLATPALRVTLSLGVASITELRAETARDLLVAAGTALNRARSQGGNRVVLCTPDLLQEPKNRTKV